MAEGDATRGNISISDEAIGELVGHTCMRCYGVVGMASQGFQEGVAQLLGMDSLRKGVKVRRRGDEVTLNLYIIVEAGVNITEVARNLIDQVKYVLESTARLEVSEVEVHVQGVRAS